MFNYTRFLTFRWFLPLYVVIALYVMLVSIATFSPIIKIGSMLNGTIAEPIVYRRLVPMATNAIEAVTPVSVEKGINDFFAALKPADLPHIYPSKYALPYLTHFRKHHNAYPVIVVFSLMFLSLLGYASALYLLARELFAQHQWLILLTPAFGLLLVPALDQGLHRLKIYDFAQLMFTALCLYTLASGRLKTYLIVFVISCFNKETTVFFLPLFAIWYWHKLSRWSYIWAILAQIVAATAILLWLRFTYSNGFTPQWFLQSSQLHAFMTGYSLQTSINLLIFIILISYGWVQKPVFLRTSLILIVPQCLAYFFYCSQGEYRNFYEILPVLTLFGMHSLAALSQVNGLDQRWVNKTH